MIMSLQDHNNASDTAFSNFWLLFIDTFHQLGTGDSRPSVAAAGSTRNPASESYMAMSRRLESARSRSFDLAFVIKDLVSFIQLLSRFYKDGLFRITVTTHLPRSRSETRQVQYALLHTPLRIAEGQLSDTITKG